MGLRVPEDVHAVGGPVIEVEALAHRGALEARDVAANRFAWIVVEAFQRELCVARAKIILGAAMRPEGEEFRDGRRSADETDRDTDRRATDEYRVRRAVAINVSNEHRLRLPRDGRIRECEALHRAWRAMHGSGLDGGRLDILRDLTRSGTPQPTAVTSISRSGSRAGVCTLIGVLSFGGRVRR